MAFLEGLLFATLVILFLVWVVCIKKLSNLLRIRLPAKYQEMRLGLIWRAENYRPVTALLRFLLLREDREYRDPEISSLSVFMRWIFYVYLAAFLLLIAIALRGDDPARRKQGPAAAESSSRADQRRATAFDLHRAGKFAEAIVIYDELLRESARDAELTYWRAMAHWNNGYADQALEDFRRVLELDPTNFNACLNADRMLAPLQRWGDILDIWDRYIRRVPDHAEAYFQRGGTNYRMGDFRAAQADAARACELGKAEGCSWAERLKGKM